MKTFIKRLLYSATIYISLFSATFLYFYIFFLISKWGRFTTSALPDNALDYTGNIFINTPVGCVFGGCSILFFNYFSLIFIFIIIFILTSILDKNRFIYRNRKRLFTTTLTLLFIALFIAYPFNYILDTSGLGHWRTNPNIDKSQIETEFCETQSDGSTHCREVSRY